MATKSQLTRQFIIEKSAPIINKKGMAGTALSDVMEATNMAKGGIYGNFVSKDEICVEAFNHLTSGVTSALDQAVANEATFRDKLYAVVDYYGTVLANNETGGCPLLNFGVETDDTNPEFKQRVARAVAKSQTRMANLVKGGQKTKEFSKRINAELFAVKMFALIEGGIFASRVTNNNAVMQSIVKVLKSEIDDL